MNPIQLIPGQQKEAGWKTQAIQRFELVRVFTDQGRVRLPFRIFGDFPLYRPGESQALAPKTVGVKRFVLVNDEGEELDVITPREVQFGILRDVFLPVDVALSGKIPLPAAIGWLCQNHWAELMQRIMEDTHAERD